MKKKTMLERIQNGEDFIKIYKDAIDEIVQAEALNVFFNTDEEYFYTTNYLEQIEEAKKEKQLLQLPRKSALFCFNVSRIFSYNELFKEDKKSHNTNYYRYREELLNEYRRHDMFGKLTDILSNKYLMFQVEYEVNHRSKDVDNVAKPFIDFLFSRIKENDNSVKRLTDSFIYKNEDSNEERIKLRVTVLNEDDISCSSIIFKKNS